MARLSANVQGEPIQLVPHPDSLPRGDGSGPRHIRQPLVEPGPRRRVLPRVPRPGLARLDVHAIGGVRGDLPDHGRLAVEPGLPRDARDADLGPRRRPRQPRLDRRADGPRRNGLHGGRRRVRCGDLTPHPAGHPGRRSDRDGIRDADRSVRGDPAHAREVQRHLPVRDHAAVPVLGHLLPGRIAALVHPAARLDHAPVSRRRAGPGVVARDDRAGAGTGDHPPGRPDRLHGRGHRARGPDHRREAGARMTALRLTPTFLIGSRRSIRLIERNLYVYKHGWLIILSGFFEPLFYLLSIGFGLGALIGTVPGPGGEPIPYQLFVAPALLASSSMNGAITEATLNFFFKLKYQKTFDAILSTPLSVADIALGEMGWGLIRGALYTTGFLVVMVVLNIGVSPWLILTLPAALLISFAFGAVGMACTSFMRTWQDFDLIQLVILPMFLFAGTFYPVETYPPGLQIVVRLTPLYQGVD